MCDVKNRLSTETSYDTSRAVEECKVCQCLSKTCVLNCKPCAFFSRCLESSTQNQSLANHRLPRSREAALQTQGRLFDTTSPKGGTQPEVHRKGHQMSFFSALMSSLRLSEQSKKEQSLLRKIQTFRQEIYDLSCEIAALQQEKHLLQQEIEDSDCDFATQKSSLLTQISSLETAVDRERESVRSSQRENEQLQLDLAKANALIVLRDHEKELLASLHTLHKERVNEAIAATAVGYGNAHIRSGISPEERPITG